MTEREYYIWLGQRFKKMREDSGMNIAQLARKIGINGALLHQFENDGKKISAFRLDALLKAFGFPSIEDIVKKECMVNNDRYVTKFVSDFSPIRTEKQKNALFFNSKKTRSFRK